MSDLVRDWFNDASAAIAKYGCKSIIETGTGPDSSALRLAHGLELPAASCDVSRPHVEAARVMWRNATVYRKNSAAFVRKILQTLEAPAFFWLDAHNCDQPDSMEGVDHPLGLELWLIAKGSPTGKDVVWCDDVDQGWYDGEALKAILADTHDAEVVGAVLRFTPR